MSDVGIATRPVDFRRGADGLAATVQSVLRQDPFSGTIFVFRWGSQVAIAVVGIEKFRLNTCHTYCPGALSEQGSSECSRPTPSPF
jgi:hypothetical protein